MRIALVNSNRIRPPIAPIALDYIAEYLHAQDHQIDVLDLCWEEDVDRAIVEFFSTQTYGLVGITLRNTDDCGFASRCSFLKPFADMVATIHGHSGPAPIIAGGVGFSVMPEAVLELCGPDAGVWGEGEAALAAVADRLDAREDWHGAPGLIWRDGDTWQRNAPEYLDLASLPPMTRSWLDNPRYFRRGGQAGFETKRGCPFHCIYCADPVAKGHAVRLRPPEHVADEVEALLAQGIDHLHTCDGEFNAPPDHALSVSRELARRDLGKRLRWYAYCTPAGFSDELAAAMRKAGCVGINFGVDHGNPEMLTLLKRGFGPEEILRSAAACKNHGITTMFDLLLGAPGETSERLIETIKLMKEADVDRIGVSLGVRVYPGTELAEIVSAPEFSAGLSGGPDPECPVFFISPAVAETGTEAIKRAIGNDERFLFFDSSEPDRNYNYNANDVLVNAIAEGHRGAYWDILRQIGSG